MHTPRLYLFIWMLLVALNIAADSETDKFAQFLETEWDYLMQEYPDWATSLGFPSQGHRWSDTSIDAVLRRQQHTREALERLVAIGPEQLSATDRLNYTLYKRDLEVSITGQAYPDYIMPITQMGGIQQSIARSLAHAPQSSSRDYDDILAKLDTSPQLVRDTLTKLKRGLAQGLTPPRITLRDIPDQIRAQMVEADNPILSAFTSMPRSMAPEQQEDYRQRAQAILTDKIVPAYGTLLDYVENTYLPAARTTIGMNHLPDGRAWYDHRIRNATTTAMTADAIHALGLREVARLNEALDALRQELKFEGNLAAFRTHMKTDPQFFFENAGDLITAYRDIAKRADYAMPGQFGILPRLPYGVMPVPGYAEKSQPTAYYRSGSLETGQAGTFFANTYNPGARPKWEMQPLTLHEAVPGHHHQLSLAQEQSSLPNFRRYGGYTAFAEGWGLYAETLGYDMGFYQTPYDRYGQLTYEMWRAVRLVVDTGIHAFDWSRAEAIRYFIDNTGKTQHDAIAEVDRYIVWPGQALAYKIGQLKISELRAHAQKELGEQFDVRDFHDHVLSEGALPLDILEKQVHQWAAQLSKH
jgi:uncharacterized protein (DUF885 family)